MKSTTLTLRLPVEIRDRLDYLAETTQRTRSALACEAISRYLDLESGETTAIRQPGAATGNADFADSYAAKKCAA